MPPLSGFESHLPADNEVLQIVASDHLELPHNTLNQADLDSSARPSIRSMRFESFSSVFSLPEFRRSHSETTPRNSRIRFPSETRSLTPHISPKSTLLDVPDRSRSVEAFTVPRDRNETISAYNESVGETSFSGTTCLTERSCSTTATQIDFEPEVYTGQQLDIVPEFSYKASVNLSDSNRHQSFRSKPCHMQADLPIPHPTSIDHFDTHTYHNLTTTATT